MSSEPIRIESETLRALRQRSAHTGEPIVRLAQRYIGGMRADRHPGIVFRDGPAGRRAVIAGGPDVWEDFRRPQLQGAPDEDIFIAALSAGRALVTENVPDFRRLETAASAAGETAPILVFTTNRQFPFGATSLLTPM